MTILVTGASGFIGSVLLEKLAKKRVSIIGRSEPKNFFSHDFYQLEINERTDYSKALSGVDTIIHLAARVHVMNDLDSNPLQAYREVNTLGTLNLAKQAVEQGVKRLIFISSIKVNGEASSLDAPFKSSDPHSSEDFYGQSKSEAELALLDLAEQTGLEVVIIRPTLVYGPGVKANFASLMNLVAKGIPLPVACINNNKRSLVSVTNLVDLIVNCIDHPKAANEVFLVSDDQDVSTSEMVEYMAKAMGRPTWQIPVPLWCYNLVGKLLGKKDVVDRLTGSLQVDIAHTKETLDWKPPQSLQDGFRETTLAFLRSKQK